MRPASIAVPAMVTASSARRLIDQIGGYRRRLSSSTAATALSSVSLADAAVSASAVIAAVRSWAWRAPA